MLKRKQGRARKYWERLTDEQLLDVELMTDDPENLDGLVREIPAGEEEPFVEFKYDLRGSGREEFKCVHGSHGHLAGFVMRKGKFRFLVGHICGKNIYGEDFEQYTADFDAAVSRQELLRRKREIEQATRPFMDWIQRVIDSGVFQHYDSVLGQLETHMPWICENLPRAAHLVGEVRFPRKMFDEATDPELEFSKIAAEFSATSLFLLERSDNAGKQLAYAKRRMELSVRRIEEVLDQLREVEDFFQPAVLSELCALANAYDNPKKRKYEFGLLSITCTRDKKRVTVHIPKSFRLPDRSAISEFRSALDGIKL